MGRKNTGTAYQRGGAWRIAYIVDGIRHFESFPTQEDAERELACRMADKACGIPVSSRPNIVLFGDLMIDVINEYKVNQRKTLEDIRTRFRIHIGPVFGDLKASAITTSQLNAYISQRRAELFRGKAPSNGQINRELEAIRHTFRLAMRDGRLLHMPHVPHLQEKNVREGFFTRQEVDNLCAQLPIEHAGFVKFAFLTGWRLGEIQNLKWSNIDFVAGEIRLYSRETKIQQGRVFPMTAELRQLLEFTKTIPRRKKKMRRKKSPGASVAPIRAIAEVAAPLVFHINGRKILEFRKTWARACQRAGLPVTIETKMVTIQRGKNKGKEELRTKRIVALRIFHDLRRSAAKHLTAQGIPERVVMEMCGWKTRSVFDRYSVVGKSDFDTAREKMDAAIADPRFAKPSSDTAQAAGASGKSDSAPK